MRKKRNLIVTLMASLGLAACLVTGSVLAVTNSNKNLGSEGSIFNNTQNSTVGGTNLADWSTTEIESYDAKYVLKDGWSDGTTTYATKKDVWNAVVSAGNVGKKVLVTMGENWQAAASAAGFIGTRGDLLIDNGHDVTFDLAGFTLDRNLSSNSTIADGRHFLVDQGGKLTINDTSANGGGKVINGNASTGSPCIHVSNGGELVINGGTFSNNKANDAYANVVVLRGTFTMNGGVMKDNVCNNYGASAGAVGIGQYGSPAVASLFTMNGGEIINNTAAGAAVVVGQNTEMGKFVMNGGIIRGNHTKYWAATDNATGYAQNYNVGGGVSVGHANAEFTMNGGLIDGNYTVRGGGGVYLGKGKFTMNGGTISNNKTGYKEDGSKFDDGTNTKACYGGGIVVFGGTIFTMNDGTITGNIASSYAGGIYADQNSNIYLYKGNVTDNQALGVGSSGGGVFLWRCTNAELGNVVITGNKLPNSAASGGGVVATIGYVTKISGGLIVKNNTNMNGLNNFYINEASVSNTNATTINTWTTRVSNSIVITGPMIKDGQSADIGITLPANAYPDKVYSTNNARIEIASGFGSTNSGLWCGDFFHADDSKNYDVEVATANYSKTTETGHTNNPSIRVRVADSMDLEWKYLEEVNGVSTWKSPAKFSSVKMDGTTQQITSNLVELPYDPNRKITAVWLYAVNTKTPSLIYNAAAGIPSALSAQVGTTGTITDSFAQISTSAGGTDIDNGIQDVGSYTFLIASMGSKFSGTCYTTSTFTIQIKPLDVTVTMQNGTGAYGDKLNLGNLTTKTPSDDDFAKKVASVTSGSANVEDLGLIFSRTYGTDAGTKNVILPVGWTNGNYNVTFTGNGGYTINKRDVTVVLNDDYLTYGDATAKETNYSKTALNGSSSILNKLVNKTTKYNDADGNPVKVEAPATPPTGVNADYYKGGWYYSTDTGSGKASAEFIAADTSTGTDYSKIIEYDITTAADVLTGDTDKYLNAKAYTINVKNINSNYNVTFVNAQTGASGATGSFLLTVREAKLSVDTTLPSLDADGKNGADFLSSTYDTTSQTVELPTAAIQKKGATTATPASTLDPTLQYWTAITDEDYKDTSFVAPKSTDTGWSTAKPTVKDAGIYHIYVKIQLVNHAELIYDFVYTMNALEVDFEIELYRKPNATGAEAKLVKNGSLAYSEEYNGQGIRAQIKYLVTAAEKAKMDADSTAPDIQYYYKGTDSGNTYGIGVAPTNTKNPDESLTLVTPPATPAPAGLGNKTAPADGGKYLVTLRDEGSYKNYVLKAGKAVSEQFEITKKKVTAPAAPSNPTVYYYNATVQAISLSGYGFDKDSMKFVEDTTNGYIEDKSPTGGTDPVAANNEKLTFSAVTQEVRVKDAGEYKLKFEVANSQNYVWDGDAATTREITVVMNGAPIYIEWDNDLTATTASDRWKWELGTEGDITYVVKYTNNSNKPYQTVSGTDDEVKIQLHWKKATDGDDKKALLSPADPNTLHILKSNTKFQQSGKLCLIVTIDTTDAISKNYAFDAKKTNPDRQEFTVDSASVNSSSFVWEYISDKTGATKANWTSSSELKFTYKYPDITNTDTSGLTYTFNLKMGTTGLDGYDYILLDSARTGFTAGYKLEKWNDGTSVWDPCTDGISDVGKYRITAALKIKDGDTEHSFVTKANDGSEVKSQEGEGSLEVEVKKGTFDLTGVKWGYSKSGKDVEYTAAFGYNGSNQTIQLINLPKGFTVAGSGYTENKKKEVGTYTAKVTGGLTVDARFEKPVISENTAVFEKAWEIEKGKIEADWTTDERTADSHVFYLPVFADETVTCVEVKYYNVNTDGTRGSEIADGAIEFDPDNPKKYVAVLTIKSTETGNYDLVDETGGIIPEAEKEFSPGADKIPVKITVSHIDDIETFNGKAHLKIEITCTSNDPLIKLESFDISIYKRVNEDNLAANVTDANKLVDWDPATHNDPTAAGKYVIAVAFKEDLSGVEDFALMSTKFPFEIKKADVKDLLSDVGWGFLEPETDDEGNIILGDDGKPKLVEKPFDPDEEIEYRLDDDGEGNYNPTVRQPVLIGIPNTQEKLDKLIKEGKVPADTKLDDVLDILKELKILDEDGESTIVIGAGASGKGSHTTEFELPSDLDDDNFEPIADMLPPGLVTSTGTPIPLNWEITPKKQDKPAKDTSVTYDGKPKGLAELAGLDPEDEGKYYEIDNIKIFDSENNEYVPVGEDFDPDNLDGTGKYQFSVKILDPTNVKWNTASGGATPEVVTVEVAKQILDVQEWLPESDEDGALLLPVVKDGDGNPVKDWEDYFELQFVDSLNNVVGTGAHWEGLGDSQYSRAKFTLRLKLKNPEFAEATEDSVLETEYTMKQIGAAASPLNSPEITLEKDEYIKGGTGVIFSNWSQIENRVKNGGIIVTVNGDIVDYASFPLKLDAGDYTIVLTITGNFYWSSTETKSLSQELHVSKQGVRAPVLNDFAFDGKSYNAQMLSDKGYMTGFDKDMMSFALIGSSKLRDAGDYEIKITLTDTDNYYFIMPEEPAASTALRVASLEARLPIEITDNDSVANYALTVTPFTLTVNDAARWTKDDAGQLTGYTLPAGFDDSVDVGFAVVPYESAESDTPMASDAGIAVGVDYWYGLEIDPTSPDAKNFVLDGSRFQYQIELTGAARFWNNTLNFLKNFWWIILIAVLLLLLILIIILAVRKKKKNAILAEERRQKELAEERERQERLEAERKEEQRMQREERMMQMRQQPPPAPAPAPQPQMPMMNPMMPMMNPMMSPMMQQPPMPQPAPAPAPAPQPIIQQMPAPAASGGASYEMMRMAEEKARAEERARMAEERTLTMMQEQQMRAAYQQPQPAAQPVQPDTSALTEERARMVEERARQMEQKLARMEMEDRIREATAAVPAAAPAPAPAPSGSREVSIKLPDSAASTLTDALSGIVGTVDKNNIRRR